MSKDSQSNYPSIKDFVLQEAFEKSFQINVLGLKDFEKEKAAILEERKESIHQELDKRHKEQLAAKRIQKSALINHSRMEKMQARNKNLLNIISSTQNHIATKIIGNQSQYRNLLKGLIVEGLVRMLQPLVLVRCLRRDSALVTGLLVEAKVDFQNLIEKEGMDSEVAKVQLKLDTRWLEERIVKGEASERVSKSQENDKCFGGVILTNEDGLIVCKNTLDARIELAYQHMLPIIRSSLFS